MVGDLSCRFTNGFYEIFSIFDSLGSACRLGSLFWGSRVPLCVITAAPTCVSSFCPSDPPCFPGTGSLAPTPPRGVRAASLLMFGLTRCFSRDRVLAVFFSGVRGFRSHVIWFHSLAVE